jgi:hypothetical protein
VFLVVLGRVIGTPKNYVLYLKSGKELKICMGATQKLLKNYLNIKSTNHNEFFFKKNIFRILKVKRSQKFV